MEHRADRVLMKAQYPLASWFAPIMYACYVGLAGVVFASVLIAAVRAYDWISGDASRDPLVSFSCR
jgi:hypothetical protein